MYISSSQQEIHLCFEHTPPKDNFTQEFFIMLCMNQSCIDGLLENKVVTLAASSEVVGYCHHS